MLSSRRAEEEEDQRDIFWMGFVLCLVLFRLKDDEVILSGWACGGLVAGVEGREWFETKNVQERKNKWRGTAFVAAATAAVVVAAAMQRDIERQQK